MEPQDRNPQEKGFILVIAVIALIVMMIFLPSLVRLSQNETKWSVKQKRTTTAFHLAEAAVDRGIWKLQESDQIWNWASTGAVITGYNFDTLYASTDAANLVEGQYVVRITTPTTGSGVMVQGVGRDISTNEERALEVVYTKTPINSGLSVRGALAYKPGLVVHWGPVVNYNNITQAPSDKYPRKICKGYITGYDTDANSPNGHDFYGTWPEPATYDYNTYQTKLGNPPTIDLEAYKTLARETSIPALKQPSGNSAATANPVGSGYYTEDTDISCRAGGNGNTWSINCSTCVIFVSGNCQMKDAASQLNLKAVICTGDFDMNADNVPNWPARIPIGARTEYLHPTAMTYWNANFAATGEGNIYTITDEVRIHGYVYVGGTANSGGGNPAIHGILDVQGTMSVNNTIVYYDSSVSTGVLALGVKPVLQSWREVNPDNLPINIP